MAKVGILNPFFSRYFLGVLTHFMALLWLEIHIRNAKHCKHCSRSCAFPQSMILFQLCMFLCQIFREKLCACVSVGAFCKADIYAKSKGEQLSTFSEKMCINDLTFGQFFCTDKV